MTRQGSGFRRRAFQALDRPGFRRGLGLARSAEILARDRELCVVAPDRAGGWRLRSRDAVLLGPAPNIRAPRRLRQRVIDVFCHVFRPGPGDVVLDIGAGVGREGIVFSRLVGADGVVHCVEAHPVTVEVLNRLCQLNQLDNVRCHHLAISDRSGEVMINTEQEADRYYRNKLVSEGRGGVAVPAVTLADFIGREQIEAVDLLAMNIEGAESAALRGMAPVVERVRNVAIGCHDFIADETGDDTMRTKSDVREFLLEHGFTVTDAPDHGPRWRRDFIYGTRRS